jgi:acrylyl-CoA reductase (NADPH)
MRGVNLLGIDSVIQPYERRVAAWTRIAQQLSGALLDRVILPATLRDLPALGEDILAGRVRGRVVVDVNT